MKQSPKLKVSVGATLSILALSLLTLSAIPLSSYATESTWDVELEVADITGVIPDPDPPKDPITPGDDGEEDVNIKPGTNNPTGYSAYFTDADSNTNLVSTSNTSHVIQSISSTGSLDDTVSRWGYNLDQSTTYKPIPAYGVQTAANLVDQTAEPGIGDINIHFGFKTVISQQGGTYKDTVMLTVLANA
jgi:hypothetical protein